MIAATISNVPAQNSVQQDQCGTTRVHDNMMQTDADYRKTFEETELKIQQIIDQNALQAYKTNSTQYIIPVVFHVITKTLSGVYNGPSDATLIAALNKLNSNYSKVVRFSNPAGQGTDIQFCLAQRDPNGCATTGIVRTSGNGIPNYVAYGKEVGPTDPGATTVEINNLVMWPNNKYLNVYVVWQLNSAAGFASYGQNLFIQNDYISGSLDPNQTVFTHEIGHILFLYHTFGLSNDGGTDCNSSDFVTDTPPHFGGMNTCPANNAPNSCVQPNGTLNDVQHNFMTYYTYACKTEFTQGQKDRMLAACSSHSNNRGRVENTMACTPVTMVADFTAAGICVGSNTSFLGTASNNCSTPIWSWTFAGGTPGSSIQQNPLVTYNTAGTYTVVLTVTNSTGTNTVKKALTINPLPSANAGVDKSICQGNTTALNASGGTTYKWSPSTGLNNTNIANPVASPASTLNYVVTVSDANGCSNTDAVTVTVNPIPSVYAGGDQTVCYGGSIMLNGSGTGTFSWSPETGLSSSTIANPVASPSYTTYYTLTSTLGNCTNQDAAIVTIELNTSGTPSISQNGNILTSSPGVSYQWYFNGVPISGATSQSYNATLSGSYVVFIRDNNGCISISLPYAVSTTGMAENNFNTSLMLYPNPNNGKCELRFNSTDNSDYTIRLIDDMEQVIYSETLSGFKGEYIKSIDISTCSKGIYFVAVTGGKENVMKKIIVY